MPGGIGVCEAWSCKCAPSESGLCSDCSIDPTFCDASGATCGQFAKKCTKQCGSTADCVDAHGQTYRCNDFTKMCDCTAPSCCAPACPPPQTCDETICACM
ncbi:MAG: hypothetical protein HY897_19885 [Deltaproteobacteria bacterium]|nr:hypothetical protein [Deltaproteobacteria bacterium]